MLIRFKNGYGCDCIFNIENIRELYIKELGGGVFAIAITGNDSERHYCECLSQERAIKALDKIYTAYANGLRAITIDKYEI